MRSVVNCEVCGNELMLHAAKQRPYCPLCVMPKEEPKNQFELDAAAETVEAQDTDTGFLCPCCPESSLHVADMFGTQVCFCRECRGFVIDRRSLGELVELLRAAYEGEDDRPIQINSAELHEVRNCPACLVKMETFSYYGPGNVVLDSCDQCQLTWFNEGELMKIIRAPGKRDYGVKVNRESELLRTRLYQQAEEDMAAGIMLIGHVFF